MPISIFQCMTGYNVQIWDISRLFDYLKIIFAFLILNLDLREEFKQRKWHYIAIESCQHVRV